MSEESIHYEESQRINARLDRDLEREHQHARSRLDRAMPGFVASLCDFPHGDWSKLIPIGIQPGVNDDGEPDATEDLALANCPTCNTTLARKVRP